LLNHVNWGSPAGNLASPLFGTSNPIRAGFGGGGSANNRQIDMQIRLSF